MYRVPLTSTSAKKARKNYIRSLYKSTKNRNKYSLLSSLT